VDAPPVTSFRVSKPFVDVVVFVGGVVVSKEMGVDVTGRVRSMSFRNASHSWLRYLGL
jgi:hypothetical protein